MPIIGIQASSITAGLVTDLGAMFPIGAVTLSATTSSITFSSIPQTYKHLQLRVFNAQGSATNGAQMYLNADTTDANYRNWAARGDGTDFIGTGGVGAYGLYYSGSTNGYSANILDFLDYTNTNKRKVMRSIQGYDLNGSGIVTFLTQLWNNTNAITSITFSSASAFQVGSSYALYGIKGA